MKDSFYWKGLRLWIEGLLLLFLRWTQLENGFDPETGLSLPSVPGMVLAAAILFLAAAEAVLCRRLPRGRRAYGSCVAPAGKIALPFLAAGSLLLGGGSVLLPGWDTLSIAAAAAGIAAALGILLFAWQTRGGAEAHAIPLLPSMVFSVLFLLSVYLPEANNPVLARYYLPVLAAALIACAFYQLAGLTCREGTLGWFVFFGDLAVPLSLAALADSIGSWGRTLIFAGCALVLTVFLALRRGEPLPEPEPEEPENQGAAESGSQSLHSSVQKVSSGCFRCRSARRRRHARERRLASAQRCRGCGQWHSGHRLSNRLRHRFYCPTYGAGPCPSGCCRQQGNPYWYR